MTKRRYSDRRRVLECAIEARREYRYFDVELLDVLFQVLLIDFHDQRGFRTSAFTHLAMFKLHTLVFDRLLKVHKGISTYDAHELGEISTAIHAAKTATKRLLRQDVAL